mgnify:CR=1 FL=1
MNHWPQTLRPADLLVTVYGAGIAGLTAAHELAEHGFCVRVVEPEQALDADGRPGLAVGGLARSQFGRAPRVRRAADLPAMPRRLDPRPVAADVELVFAPGESALDAAAEARLTSLVATVNREFPDYRLRIAAPAQALSARRTAAIRRHLVESLGLEDARVVAAADAALEPDTLLVGVDAAVLPGEHGFRFFPSYYRHVFDTMRRIPLRDRDGRPTGRTVLDRLVSTPVQAMLRRDRPPLMHRRTPSRSPALLHEELAGLRALGYTRRDLAQFLVRVLRYMCTSDERRAAELAGLSWWQYLCGHDPRTRLCRYGYSEAFTRDTLFSTRVLAAFDAQWGDAHTNGDTYVQLFLNRLVDRDRVDAVLDGPTSTAWFQPWREQLVRLGVRFEQARLERLTLEADGRVRAWIRGPSDESPRLDERSDYIVVATDVATAEEVTRALPPTGVPGQLRGFTTRVDPSPRDPYTAPIDARDPRRACGLTPWDRLQTLTGVQYFFARADVKVARGHLYLLDAPWGLSAICSQQFWSTRPEPDVDGYRSLLSVDIGAWTRPAPLGGDGPPRAASEVPLDVVAAEVFHQVSATLAGSIGALPAPSWYHVDTHLIPDPDDRARNFNRSPYLIPIVGDWSRRPGGEPSVPGEAQPRVPESIPPGVWQAERGGYWVHHGNLVFAGTFMRTFTRMTTMESANESGRHAANAILDHALAVRSHVPRRLPREAPPPGPPLLTGPVLDGPDECGGSRPFATTPLGDYSAIWPIGDHELPDLAPAKRHDAELLRRGLPHPWDLSGVETMLVLAAEGIDGAPDWADMLERMLSALRAAMQGSTDQFAAARQTLEALQQLRRRIEQAARHEHPGSPG